MKSKTHAHFFGFGNVLRRFKDKDPAVLKLLENKKFNLLEIRRYFWFTYLYRDSSKFSVQSL